jgi:hypothetical protein
MAKLAELFEGRFDISYGDDGVSLNCTECPHEGHRRYYRRSGHGCGLSVTSTAT